MKISFLVTIIALMIICCTKKGEPSKQGELLKIEQIGKLSVDRSMNGKLVTIEGYVGFCNNSMFVQLGKKNKISIYRDGLCKGEKLADAEIEISGNSIPLSGDKPRNYASFPDEKNLTDESLMLMTDDYQEIPNGNLKFSGRIVYQGDGYYLENVTIHK